LENNNLKDKVKALEQEHMKERKDSQREFEVFKQGTAEKEAHLEKQYKEKALDMKDNIV